MNIRLESDRHAERREELRLDAVIIADTYARDAMMEDKERRKQNLDDEYLGPPLTWQRGFLDGLRLLGYAILESPEGPQGPQGPMGMMAQ